MICGIPPIRPLKSIRQKLVIRIEKKKDVSEITYYNYNKKNTIRLSAQSVRSQKTSVNLDNLHINDWY